MAEDRDDTECQTLPSGAYGGTGNIRTKSLQRKQMISNICMMKTNKSELMQLSVYQLEVKLSLLERHLQSFEMVQLDLESLDESEIVQNHRVLFEEAYYEIKSVILERLAFHNGNVFEPPFSSTRLTTQSNSHRPLLPTLQLCKFSGNYKDWMESYNVFCQQVHDNQDLSPVSKFQYLKSCLTDSAARLIQSLEVTALNYEAAFNLLKTRYDNKIQLFQSHLLEIFNIERVSKPNVMSLRLFIDNINASMRALESIATKQQITDGIMLHLIVSKLDTELQAKWEDSLSLSSNTSISSSTLHLPSWDDLASFLERRCKSLEIYENTNTTSAREQQQINRNFQHKTNRAFSSKNQTASYISSNQQSKCIICDSVPNHSVFHCAKFVDMNVVDRFKTVKHFKLCSNCLGVNHIATSCPSLNRCQKCKASHHTLLHKETPPSHIEDTPQASADIVTPTSCLHVSEEKSLSILATAMIELSSANGASMMVRALLDSCSQSNFITERMAHCLRLPRKKVNINICGIGGTNAVCAKYACNVTARSLASEFSTTFDAVILSSISSCQPQRYINVTDWTIPANIKLADRGFNVPGPVDVLIGVSLFWDLLMVGSIKAENQPNFIKTKLGWIVSGSAHKFISPQNSRQHVSKQTSAVMTTEPNNNVVLGN